MAKRILFFASSCAILTVALWFAFEDAGIDDPIARKERPEASVTILSTADTFYERAAKTEQHNIGVYAVPVQQPPSAQAHLPAGMPNEVQSAYAPALPIGEPASMAEAEELIARTGSTEGSLADTVRAFEKSQEYSLIATPQDTNVSLHEILQNIQSRTDSSTEPVNVFANPFGGIR